MKIYKNPTVPFQTDVNLTEQKKFIIKGLPHRKPLLGAPCSFKISFQKGKASDAENIAFQCDVRFFADYPSPDHNQAIALNYKKNGEWGKEEIIHNNFPFSDDGQFTIEILVDVHMYTVDVNSKEVAQFRHQMPLQTVDCLAIDGNVILDEVKLM